MKKAPLNLSFGVLGAAILALLVFAVPGCGDSTAVRGTADAGEPCSSSSDCLPGLACNADANICVGPSGQLPDGVDDDMNGGDMSSDDMSSDGDQPDGNMGDNSTCAALEVEFSAVVPTIVMLVDRSGSMEEPFGATDRWQAVQDALFDPTNGVVTRYGDAVRFGVATYNSDGGDAGGTCPVISSVSAQVGNVAAMEMLLADQSPSGDTPTGESVEAMIPLFGEIEERAPKVLLLATDGEPDTCAVPNPQEGQPESIAGVQRALENGIRTFVLSVGSDVGEPHLQDLANTGIGLPLDGPEMAPFWKADDPGALAQAIADIITGARPCVFSVDGAVIDPAKANLGQVSLNGESLAHSGPDGWTLVEDHPECLGGGQCVELHGDACTTVQLDPEPQLDASFPCEAAQ